MKKQKKKQAQLTPFEELSFHLEKMSADLGYALIFNNLIITSKTCTDDSPNTLQLREVLKNDPDLGNLIIADSIIKEALMILA
jgi:hypothetical protein